MTSENKNKSKLRLKTKSKILALGLMLIILVGILSPVLSPVKIARADAHPDEKGTCILEDGVIHENLTRGQCNGMGIFVAYSDKNPPPEKSKEKSFFSQAVSETRCGLGSWTGGGSLAGCLLQFVYYTFYMLGSFLLWLAALLFNFLISYTLDSKLLRSDFIASSWGIVRDLSNIFFILILLYIAVKIILDIGGSEVKKMIGKVVIIALLINFSMFFTQVIIDSSNILALIFYNKIKTEKETPNGQKEEALDSNGKKDISGGLTKSFNPAYQLKGDFFEKAGDKIILEGKPSDKSVVSIGVLIGITVISGLIMILAAYALFISSLSFLGRLVELFILIIFSPFAFLSSTIPLLKNAEYLGWDNWFKRLLKVAFMAPIFMFFLYFIFLLLSSKNGEMFSSAVKGEGFWAALLNLAIPALVILILLSKATKFAKEGSGALGEAMIKGAKIVAGVGLGVAGGVALGALAKGGQATVGKYGEKIAKSETVQRLVKRGTFGADSFQRATSFLGGRDFDLRKGAVGGFLKSAEGVTGLNFGSASKFLLKPGGGYRGDRERAEKKRQERANKLKVSEDEPLKQKLNEKEGELQEMNNENSHEIKQREAQRKVARENLPEFEQAQKAARGNRDIAKNKLDNVTEGTTAEKEYDKKKADLGKIAKGVAETEYDKREAEFEAIIASGLVAGNPVYDAAETAYLTARAAASAPYVAAKNAYDGARTTAGTPYVAAKDDYDEAENAFQETNNELNKRTENIKALTNHRSAIKNTKAIVDENGEIDVVANEEEYDTAKAQLTLAEKLLAETKTEEAKAKAILKAITKDYDEAKATFDNIVASGVDPTDQAYIDAEAAKDTAAAAVSANPAYVAAKNTFDTVNAKLKTQTADEEQKRRRKEIATAAFASARFGKGQSINDYEDKILPEAREAIENENRERLISYAKRNIRGSDDGIINAIRTMGTTAGDDQASRKAAAHKIIMEVKIENSK